MDKILQQIKQSLTNILHRFRKRPKVKQQDPEELQLSSSQYWNTIDHLYSDERYPSAENQETNYYDKYFG